MFISRKEYHFDVVHASVFSGARNENHSILVLRARFEPSPSPLHLNFQILYLASSYMLKMPKLVDINIVEWYHSCLVELSIKKGLLSRFL